MKRYSLRCLCVVAVLSLGLVHCGGGDVCIPDCEYKCGGPDGCGGTCAEVSCPADQVCNQSNWICEKRSCTSDEQCTDTQCCRNNFCQEKDCSALECGPDSVCGKECGPCTGTDVCVDGVCASEPPQGGVDAVYAAAIPADEPMTAGNSYSFTYQVIANFMSPLAEEDFRVQATLIPGTFGSATIPPGQGTLSFSPPGAEATITVTVTPSGGASNADLDVSVFAVRNSTLRSSQLPISLTLGSLPPVDAFFYYAGPRLNEAGRLEIPQNQLTRPQGRNIILGLRNASPSENRTYQITRHIVPDVADASGWSPLTPAALPLYEVAPDRRTYVHPRVDGPKAPAPPAPVGTTGYIVVTAELTAIDGAPPAESQERTVTVPFVVGE